MEVKKLLKSRVYKLVKLFFSTEKTFKQKYNLILTTFNYFFLLKHLSNYPIILTIDPCNFCNLSCTFCPAGSKKKARKRSTMSFETFRKLIDECGPYLWMIYLYNWGEPLLNPEIFKMVKYAREKKIDVEISSNLNYFNEDICNNLVESGLNKLKISLHGASEDTVTKYIKGCNFELVINNIRQIIDLKKKHKNKFPIIEWYFIVNKFNEKEIEKAKILAKELKVDILQFGSIRCDMSKEIFLNNNAQYECVKEWLPENESFSMYNYSRKEKKVIKKKCKILWTESTVQPDGSISPCCAVWPDKYDFGNIHDTSFNQIWNSLHYFKARQHSKEENTSIGKNHICYICSQNRAQI